MATLFNDNSDISLNTSFDDEVGRGFDVEHLSETLKCSHDTFEGAITAKPSPRQVNQDLQLKFDYYDNIAIKSQARASKHV